MDLMNMANGTITDDEAASDDTGRHLRLNSLSAEIAQLW
jgi:hypothetical protein